MGGLVVLRGQCTQGRTLVRLVREGLDLGADSTELESQIHDRVGGGYLEARARRLVLHQDDVALLVDLLQEGKELGRRDRHFDGSCLVRGDFSCHFSSNRTTSV